MRGEPVLSSKCISLFDISLSNESNNQPLQKRFVLYHELDHHCEKFDENLLDFGKHLTQTVADIQELLDGTYAHFPILEKIPQLIDIDTSGQSENLSNRLISQNEITDILNQSSLENEQLPEPLLPEILQQQINNN